MKTKRILILEDDKEVRDSLVADYAQPLHIEQVGPVCFKSDSTDKDGECYSLYKKNFYDLLMLDLVLYGERGGLRLLEKIRQKDELTPIMVVSGLAEREDWPIIGRHAYNYFYDKNLSPRFGINRFNQSIKYLVDGESNFRKIHKNFYLPVVLAEALFDCELYSSTLLKGNRLSLLESYRSPETGFQGKGLIGLLDQVCDAVDENLKTLCRDVLRINSILDFTGIKETLTGILSLKNMEQLLSIDSEYREHFVHQFQNLLLGCLLYECFRDKLNGAFSHMFRRAFNIERMSDRYLQLTFEVAWFFTTMFHDFAYPVQDYDPIALRYFRENYRYRFLPLFLPVEGLYVREAVDMDLDGIAKGFWLDSRQSESFRLLLTHAFMSRNHGVHSAVALRRLIRYHASDDVLCQVFAPIFSAIALHDWDVWSNAHAVQEALLDKRKKSVSPEQHYQYKIDFAADIQTNALLHMLLIVDNIQDWGRPKGGNRSSNLGTSNW